LTLWSNFFLKYQLFISLPVKDKIQENFIYNYQFYTYVLEGKISWEDWINFSPKQIALFIKTQERLRELKKEAFSQAQKGLDK
jgi:hypothetical protein